MRVLRSLLLTALAFSLSLATPLPPSYTPSGEPLRFVKRHATELSQRALLSKLTSFLCDQPVLTKICSMCARAPSRSSVLTLPIASASASHPSKVPSSSLRRKDRSSARNSIERADLPYAMVKHGALPSQ